jgi:hypothetical protein
MVYAENSLHYWRNLVRDLGLRSSMLERLSIGEIMSQYVELSSQGQKPLVKVYTANRLRRMFGKFDGVKVYKRQLIAEEVPARLRWLPVGLLGRLMGWNLIVKAAKPG